MTDGAPGELREALAGARWALTALRLSGMTEVLRRPRAENSGSGAAPREAHAARAAEAAAVLEALRAELGECARCPLHEQRHRIVFGEGSPVAPVVFVGEGPGFEEDRDGRPFVGRAGKLLDKMIRAMGLTREAVYICNVVKCRPPQNRTPEPEEVAACGPWLVRQIEAIGPRVVVALGASAANMLLGASRPISTLRGKSHAWRGIPLVATFHPAYLLRTPSQKAAAWKDLLAVMELLRTEDDPEEA